MTIAGQAEKEVSKDFYSFYNNAINEQVVDRFYNLGDSYALALNSFRVIICKKGYSDRVSISLDRLTKINLESQLVLKFNLLSEWEIQRLSKSILSICGVGV